MTSAALTLLPGTANPERSASAPRRAVRTASAGPPICIAALIFW